MKNKIELLMPAGDLTRLKVALLYGADAVFIGGKKFSLRAKASNFTIQDIKEGVDFAHALNKKIYVTVNIIPHSSDLDKVEEYLLSLDSVGVDAIIVSSLYIIDLVRRLGLRLECHVSTQVSALNQEYVNFYKELGCTRVVLARECSVKEIEEIKNNVSLELEVFIQGGLCSSYSGKCTLSNYFVDRDANRGGCAHSCRWDYTLYHNDEVIDLLHPFKIASKDLMGIRKVKELIYAGVSSLKVEGRMKSINYVALVSKAYRKVIDAVYENKLTEDILNEAEQILRKVENRPLCQAFLNDAGVSHLDQIYLDESLMVNQTYLGYVADYDKNTGVAKIIRKNDIKIGDNIEIVCFDGDNFDVVVEEMFDKDGPVFLANKTENDIFIKINKECKKYYLIRKK